MSRIIADPLMCMQTKIQLSRELSALVASEKKFPEEPRDWLFFQKQLIIKTYIRFINDLLERMNYLRPDLTFVLLFNGLCFRTHQEISEKLKCLFNRCGIDDCAFTCEHIGGMWECNVRWQKDENKKK